MDLNLKERVFIITGGAGKRGSIGETIVNQIAAEGGIPVIIDRNKRGFEMEKKFNKKGVDALFIQTDLTDNDACKDAIERVIDKYDRIDVVVNNVGVNDGVSLENSYDEFLDSLKLNLISYFLITKYALPQLRISSGNIINIGSKVALTGQGGTSGYAAAKGGVLALTREWAVDLVKDNIRVNAIVIAESWTPAYENWLSSTSNPEEERNRITSKIPLGNRMTTPLEIADALLFLASDRSSHTTGQFVFVDGGYVHLDRALIQEKKMILG